MIIFRVYRMLGFDDALCAVHGGYFGQSSSPTLINHVYCVGYASALDLCSYFSGWEEPSSYSYCSSHDDDVGVICLDG